MICYSFLEKRGGVIKKKITWQLKSNKELIIDKEIYCEYKVNKYIKYIEEEFNIINTIDLENKRYERDSEEFLFVIDFTEKTFYYLLKENDIELKDQIECKYVGNDKKIHLIYKLDDDIKEIVIHFI